MAKPDIRPIDNGETDEEALQLVRTNLLASERFKREYWPTEKILTRRLAYEGDPAAYTMPYNSDWGAELVNNWALRQINHKVGKLEKSAIRLNLKDARGLDDDATRIMLSALEQRLLHKAREAKWSLGRRKMLLDAAKTGYGVRCVGLRFDRKRYYVTNMRVRAEEWHMDPTAESIEDAEWTCWRRYVAGSKLGDTLRRNPDIRPAGASTSLVPDARPAEIALRDDAILAQGRGMTGRGAVYAGVDPYLVSDHYSRDQSMDFYYPCSGCGEYSGVSMVQHPETPGRMTPVYQCSTCGKKESKAPPRSSLRRMARYPNGKHVRIIGAGDVDYRGPNRIPLEDVHPFVGMSWYEGEVWAGISEIQQLQAPILYNMIAMNMIADNAFSNAHSKVFAPSNGITNGWNNNPNDWMEVSSECFAAGGPKTLQMGDVSASARILLERSIQDLWLMAGNSPEAQGQAPDTIRSGVGLGRIIAASEVGLLLTLASLVEADARFFRIARDLCALVDGPAKIPVTAPDGTPGTFDYDRSLMGPNVNVEVLTERDVEQEREEMFSRAVELRGMQVAEADDQMLLDLSGIPADVVQRARDRVAAKQAQMAQMGGGLPPEIGGGQPGAPAPNGNGIGDGLPASLKARMAGAHAPQQARPPARSRGAGTPEASIAGAG